ncbi:MAG: FecR family protein [Bacteroidales bacterium]
MDFTKEEYFKRLINRYLTNQASDKDVEELQLLIVQSDDNRKQFIEFSRAWILTSQSSPKGKFNKAKYDEWKKLSDKLSSRVEKLPRITISPLQKAIRIAAVFLLLVSAGSTIAWIITSQRLQSLASMETINHFNVQLGGRGEVILPDGSKVRLNAGSNISYSNNFGFTERNVILEGEGYFEVETNPKMPFVVETSGLKIKAFGTTFNVKAYPDEEEIITTLIEGIVRIEGENIDLAITPSQKVTYIKGQYRNVMPDEEKPQPETEKRVPEKMPEIIEPPKLLLANNINTHQVTAWKDGIFIFDAEKLSNLKVILERKYDVSIKIESEELKNYRFTGTFHQETLEQILGIINLSAPIKYEIEKGVVTIQLDQRRSGIFKELSMN